MLNIILNIIGMIFIIFGIYIIRKDLSRDKEALNDLVSIEERVKEYYNTTEDSIEKFYDIIDEKLIEINRQNNLEKSTEQEDTPITENKIIVNKNELPQNDTNIIELQNKVLGLSKIGLNSEEIAKRLNKGRREIEIILKIYKDKKNGKTI